MITKTPTPAGLAPATPFPANRDRSASAAPSTDAVSDAPGLSVRHPWENGLPTCPPSLSSQAIASKPPPNLCPKFPPPPQTTTPKNKPHRRVAAPKSSSPRKAAALPQEPSAPDTGAPLRRTTTCSLHRTTARSLHRTTARPLVGHRHASGHPYAPGLRHTHPAPPLRCAYKNAVPGKSRTRRSQLKQTLISFRSALRRPSSRCDPRGRRRHRRGGCDSRCSRRAPTRRSTSAASCRGASGCRRSVR